MSSGSSGVEAHQASEVSRETAASRALGEAIRATLGFECRATRCDAGSSSDDENEKMVLLIRHGEGAHNVAQREWRNAGKAGEPYTVDNDPDGLLRDAELTALGREQAAALKDEIQDAEIVFASPMRRATQTALLGASPEVPVLAVEALHETGGRHTCDRRLDKADLATLFPRVDYSLIQEVDPLWHDTQREDKASIAARAADFLAFLRTRPEKIVAVATHSGFLLTLLNAVLLVDNPDDAAWFATGECRAFTLAFSDTSLPN